MVIPYLVFLALLAAERLVELALSRRHRTWVLARGGKELGERRFVLMKLLHGAFLVGCAAEVVLLDRPFLPVLAAPMLVLALLAQGLRYWAVFTLGPYWNVRVLVVPGARPVSSGPYRFVRHPNYAAVVVEGLAVPLIHTAWWTAIAFTVLNGVLLHGRICREEEALNADGSYRDVLGDRPRFIPRLSRSVTRPVGR
jgi:methyltransferase